MKKIYSYLMALIALLTCMVTASAEKVTVKVNDSQGLTVTKDEYVDNVWVSDQPVEVKGTETVFECALYGTVHVYPTDGYIIMSCKVNGVEDSYFQSGINVNGDLAIDVTIAKLSDVQTGSFKLKVDNPEKVVANLTKSGLVKNLQAGDNVVNFIPELDNVFSVRGESYSKPLYKVIKNGELITENNYGTYQFVPEQDMEIEVLANFPDEDELVTISYNEGGEGCITQVFVNRDQEDEAEVTDFNNGFNVKCGQKVTIVGNTEDFDIKSVMINGKEERLYSSLEFLVIEPTTVSIVAEKYGTIKAHVIVDDASRVQLFKGDRYRNNLVEIHDGDNEVEVGSKNPTITIACTDTSVIKSVKVGDEDVESDYRGEYPVKVTEGTVITVTSELAKTLKFTLYNSKPAVMLQTGKSYARINVEGTGYSEYEFKEDEFPITIYPPYDYSGNNEYRSAFFYIDDVLQNEEAAGMFTFTPDCDNCVLKIYSAAWDETPENTYKPNLHTLTFAIDEEVKDAFSVLRDKVKIVDTAAELKALDGTLVEIIPTDALGARVVLPALVVTVGDKNVEADENGVFAFTVDSDAKVSITKNTESGVSEIETVEGAAHAVYNLQGIKVLDNAEGLNSLPSGVYIVNGKKVMK